MTTQQSTTTLLTPIDIAGKTAPNRVFLSPMTRGRARLDRFNTFLASQEMVAYYGQRSHSNGGAGVVITEAVPISDKARGWVNVPGIWSEAQVDSWRPVAEAITSNGSVAIMQLWHTGRVSHSHFGNGQPVSASAVTANGEAHTPKGKVPYETPREMTLEEINSTIQHFVDAAKNALSAGFDGVELHAANGYLIHQFLSSKSNKRTDEYGQDRSLFLKRILQALQEALGDLTRVAVRLSPTTKYGDCLTEDPKGDYVPLVQHLDGLKIAFLDVVEDRTDLTPEQYVYPAIRKAYTGILTFNSGLDYEAGEKLVATGDAEGAMFGRPFLANPDFVRRATNGTPLAQPDYSRLFYVDPELAKGYSDYPAAQ